MTATHEVNINSSFASIACKLTCRCGWEETVDGYSEALIVTQRHYDDQKSTDDQKGLSQ